MYQNGDNYRGNFKNSEKFGVGEYTWAKHKEFKHFKGAWKSDMMHGTGTMQYIDGRVYEGEWQHDKKKWQRKMISYNGSLTGTWKNDQVLEGIFTYDKQNKQCVWKNNKPFTGYYEEKYARLFVIKGLLKKD